MPIHASGIRADHFKPRFFQRCPRTARSAVAATGKPSTPGTPVLAGPVDGVRRTSQSSSNHGSQSNHGRIPACIGAIKKGTLGHARQIPRQADTGRCSGRFRDSAFLSRPGEHLLQLFHPLQHRLPQQVISALDLYHAGRVLDARDLLFPPEPARRLATSWVSGHRGERVILTFDC